MPDPQMSLNSAFGFRAQPCYACLSLGLVPVFYPDKGHNLPQFTHSCNPFNFQPKIFKSLEDYSTPLLKDVAIQTGFIDLIAIPLSEPHQEFLMLTNPRNPKKPLVLTFSNESKIELNIDDLTGHWLERAITTGEEKTHIRAIIGIFLDRTVGDLWVLPYQNLLSNHMIILWP